MTWTKTKAKQYGRIYQRTYNNQARKARNYWLYIQEHKPLGRLINEELLLTKADLDYINNYNNNITKCI